MFYINWRSVLFPTLTLFASSGVDSVARGLLNGLFICIMNGSFNVSVNFFSAFDEFSTHRGFPSLFPANPIPVLSSSYLFSTLSPFVSVLNKVPGAIHPAKSLESPAA